MRHLLVYAQLLRLPNTFTAWADIFLAALASGWVSARWRWFWQAFFVEASDEQRASAGDELARWGGLLCLLAASTLLYWSGMIWNDYFDLEQDRRERPSRPLANGSIPVRVAVILGLCLMAGGILLAALADLLNGHWRALWFAGALVLAIYLYDGVLKKTIAGPVLMGSCRSFNVLMGLTIVGAWPPPWGWLLALIIGTYIAGVTWFASTEAQEKSSQPMLIGAAVVMLVSLALALTVPALTPQVSPYFEPSGLYPYLLTAFGVYVGIAVIRAIRKPQPLMVQTAIKRSIFGLVILDALLASAFVGSAGLLLVLLLVPGLVLGRWVYST